MAYLVQFVGGAPVIKFALDKPKLLIGEDFNNDICVPEDGIADLHAVLEIQPHPENNKEYQVIIKATEGNTLMVNNQVCQQACLTDDDWIKLGEIDFEYSSEGGFPFSLPAAPTSVVVTKTEVKPRIQPTTTETLSQPKPKAPQPSLAAASTSSLQNSRFSRRLNIF